MRGVTTNPTLVLQAGLRVALDTYTGLVQAAADAGLHEIMLQLPRPDAHEALQWLDVLQQKAADSHVTLTIKLPCHADWLPCIQAVQSRQQALLLTGLSNPVQLLWAQAHQAHYVAPYIGRLAADGRDVWALMEACVAVQKDGPALLAASIKSPDVLTRLVACGAAAATLPPASLIAWAGDALTDVAMAQFEKDVAASQTL